MLRNIKIPFFTILFLFLGVFLYTKFFGPIPFSVTSVVTTKQNLFTTQGTGEVAAIPDTALVSLGVNKEAATVEAAQTQVNGIINKITSDLKSLGVDPKNIKTTNYNVSPQYDYNSGQQVARGYTVSANIEVKVTPIEKANQAIDIATKDGATQVGNVQFVLDDTKQKQLENQAREEAIKEAKEKASSIAKTAGITLGRIVDVQESTSGGIQPMYRTTDLKLESAGSEAPPTELNPGENKVSVTVSLSYETF